jgi:hypothetical protein
MSDKSDKVIMEFICSEVDKLDKKCRIRVLEMFADAGVKVSENSNGSSVILNNVDDEVLNKIYSYILSKVKNS